MSKIILNLKGLKDSFNILKDRQPDENRSIHPKNYTLLQSIENIPMRTLAFSGRAYGKSLFNNMIISCKSTRVATDPIIIKISEMHNKGLLNLDRITFQEMWQLYAMLSYSLTEDKRVSAEYLESISVKSKKNLNKFRPVRTYNALGKQKRRKF